MSTSNPASRGLEHIRSRLASETDPLRIAKLEAILEEIESAEQAGLYDYAEHLSNSEID